MEKDYEILLSSLFENGTLNTTEAEHIIYMSKKNQVLRKYTSEAGVPYYSSHKIRFTTASCLYNGKNLTQVSRALGHSQVSTTLHYFRNVENDEDLLEQMESAFSIK